MKAWLWLAAHRRISRQKSHPKSTDGARCSRRTPSGTLLPEQLDEEKMDKILTRLVDYTKSFSQAELTPPVADAAVNHLFDSMAVAVAGAGSEPGRILARIAKSSCSNG